jgi:hypothetical protein
VAIGYNGYLRGPVNLRDPCFLGMCITPVAGLQYAKSRLTAIYYQTAESRTNTWALRLLKAWKPLCPILVENLQSAVSKGTELTVIDADVEF